jgi:hypothetical protein
VEPAVLVPRQTVLYLVLLYDCTILQVKYSSTRTPPIAFYVYMHVCIEFHPRLVTENLPYQGTTAVLRYYGTSKWTTGMT